MKFIVVVMMIVLHWATELLASSSSVNSIRQKRQDDDISSSRNVVQEEKSDDPHNTIINVARQQNRHYYPTFVATASRILRPNSVYRVNFVLLSHSDNMAVRALVTKDNGQYIASEVAFVNAGSSHNLLLKIPSSITNGKYRLKLEGFDSQNTQKSLLVKESQLQFHSDFLSIVIQSNRKVFRNGMSVRFRVILTQMDLKPYTDPVTIYILNPDGFVMRRWPSRYSTNGVVSLTYDLPSYPGTGDWTIRVEAMQQVQDYQFIVERFYITFFEVMPTAPAYVLDSEESYTVEVGNAIHKASIVSGNTTMQVHARPVNSSFSDYRLVSEEHLPWNYEFSYDVNLADVKSSLGVRSLTGWVIRVTTLLHHYFMGETREGFIETRIIDDELKFEFAGPKTAVFKPGMPFEGHVYLMYDDDQSLSPEKLAGATLTLRPVVTMTNGQLKNLPEIVVPTKGEYLTDRRGKQFDNEFDQWMERQAEDAEFAQFRETGVFHFSFFVPKDASKMKILATYKDEDGEKADAELRGVAFYSASEMYVNVVTSTKQGHLGENAIFHLRSNFGFQVYSYVIISKGLVIHGATESHPHPTKLLTYSVPVSSEMAPTFKLVAMIINPLGELVADSVTIPVKSFNRYKMNVTTVQFRDHSKETVQLVTRSLPRSFVGLSVLRFMNYLYQADNVVTPSRMLKSLYKLEPFTTSVHGVTWTDREGLKADRTEYFKGSNPGADTKRTFSLAGLLVFTDAKISQYPDTAYCDRSNGFESCMAVGCFHKDQRCDGKLDCSDGSDEDECPPEEDDRMLFRLARWSRNHDFYDWLDGDWAWYDVPTTDDGIEFSDRTLVVTDEIWYINAFSFHPELGFSMMDEDVEYDSTPPVLFQVESPSSIRRGETVGIRLIGMNFQNEEVMALIVLEASDDYLFVETNKDGEVEHYRPSLVGGERHHMVTIKALSMTEVHVPIAPQIEEGVITIRIQTNTQINRQNIEIELEIIPEGATISRHTSLLLDLKNRAHVLRFLDIPVEESPIIPYSKFRRYVFGSTRASVTLCGDVFGPVFPSSPITTESLLSRPLRGTEANLFNFATTMWSLHYLRLTNQLEPDVLYSGLNDMNVQMADLMRLYNQDGSFRAHRTSQPSVWVTAWVVRILGQSQFQDWENNFYVDLKLLTSSVKWLLQYQRKDGSFAETDAYPVPLDRRLMLSSNSSLRGAHTAHVLISLSACGDSLEGSVKVAAASAKIGAARFLERILNTLSDQYEVAIVTYALQLTSSPAQESSFGRLHSLRRENEGMIYWSRQPVPTNQIVYENQRPFIQPRSPNQQDSLAVEASSYALLVYLARDGIGDLQERVVTWLNTMRMVDGGFVSIYDSIVAMEALTEYAYRARLREITDMTIVVDASASPDARESLRISSDSLSTVHTFNIPNVWGHVNVIGRGAGQAVMQLKVQYGIDWEDLRDFPQRRYFDLYVEETYSHFRNKSHIKVDACVKWLALDEAPTSGAVTLEVELPSGYVIVQSDASEVLVRKEFNFLSDVLVANDKVVWMFDKVGPERTCFNYVIHRWFPVANGTMYRSAIVYESHSPEHFEMQVFNATPLYVLDICEVCGSYQCPYCPYFSAAQNFSLNPIILLCSLISTFISLNRLTSYIESKNCELLSFL